MAVKQGMQQIWLSHINTENILLDCPVRAKLKYSLTISFTVCLSAWVMPEGILFQFYEIFVVKKMTE